MYTQKLHYFCNTHTHTHLMMAQDWVESTSEIINYGRFINKFPLDIINKAVILCTVAIISVVEQRIERSWAEGLILDRHQDEENWFQITLIRPFPVQLVKVFILK